MENMRPSSWRTLGGVMMVLGVCLAVFPYVFPSIIDLFLHSEAHPMLFTGGIILVVIGSSLYVTRRAEAEREGEVIPLKAERVLEKANEAAEKVIGG